MKDEQVKKDPEGRKTGLICPGCGGEVILEIKFSNIYCGYHANSTCPGNCSWSDSFAEEVKQKLYELGYC